MPIETNCWGLIKQRNFIEACKKADTDYEITKSLYHLSNKVIALLNLKEYKEALKLSIELNNITKGRSDSHFIFSGVSYWLLGDFLNAVNTWKDGLNTQYTDAAGGVEIPALLFYAAVLLHDNDLEEETIKLLKKRFKSKNSLNYPGHIAGYILDKISDDDFLNAYNSFEGLRERTLCKAYFYIAIKCLKNGDKNGFYNNLEKCISNDTYLESEYYLAIGELDKKVLI